MYFCIKCNNSNINVNMDILWITLTITFYVILFLNETYK